MRPAKRQGSAARTTQNMLFKPAAAVPLRDIQSVSSLTVDNSCAHTAGLAKPYSVR